MSDNTPKKILLSEAAMRRFAEIAGLSDFSDEIVNEGAQYFTDPTKKLIKESGANCAPSVKKPTKDTTGDLSYKEKSAPKGSGAKVITDDKATIEEGDNPLEEPDEFGNNEPSTETPAPEGDFGGDGFGEGSGSETVDVDLMSLASDLAQMFKKNFPNANLGMTLNGQEVPSGDSGFDEEVPSVDDGMSDVDVSPESEFEDTSGAEEVPAPAPEPEKFQESKKHSKIANMIYEAIMDKLTKKAKVSTTPKKATLNNKVPSKAPAVPAKKGAPPAKPVQKQNQGVVPKKK